jgi:hypothetical protein
MPSPEHTSAPSPYSKLYAGFGNIAARGTIDYGPLDAAFSPGNDGTRTPDGDVAYGFDHTIGSNALPQAILDKGIDELGVWSYAGAVVNHEVWPACVRVKIHEPIGMSKTITFFENEATGEITAYMIVEPDDALDETPQHTLESSEQSAIIQNLFKGELHWLKLEGPEGNFARSIYATLTAPDRPGIDEIELLDFILEELGR